jgi:hypothetical protein
MSNHVKSFSQNFKKVLRIHLVELMTNRVLRIRLRLTSHKYFFTLVPFVRILDFSISGITHILHQVSENIEFYKQITRLLLIILEDLIPKT